MDLGDWAAGILMLAGGSFALLAALGLLRLPDFYVRLHAATKVSTMVMGLLAFAYVAHFRTLEAATQAFVLTLFIFLTAPVAAHMLGRAAYRTGVPFMEGTQLPADPDEPGQAPVPGPTHTGPRDPEDAG